MCVGFDRLKGKNVSDASDHGGSQGIVPVLFASVVGVCRKIATDDCLGKSSIAKKIVVVRPREIVGR